MARIKLPRYMRQRKISVGVAYYWEPPAEVRQGKVRHGLLCPVVATALGADLADAIRKAEGLNEALDAWRKDELAPAIPTPGTVRWLFYWYRKTHRFERLAPKTKADYRKLMSLISDLGMKVGKFGDRQASIVTPEVADALYSRLRERGERQATYAMQVCRAVWNVAVRYDAKTGVTRNPFTGMSLNHRVQVGNRAATREELDHYKAAARRLGYPSMAVAASLAFEFVQRVSDVFGFADPFDPSATALAQNLKARGMLWEDYRPGVSFKIRQAKTGRLVTIPLADSDGTLLYPELENDLAAIRGFDASGLIIRQERNRRPFQHRSMMKVHRQICRAAGLSDDIKMTSFRHGGATELGDAGEADIRAISGHTQISTTAVYNQANEAKARRMARNRRSYVGKITGSGPEGEP